MKKFSDQQIIASWQTNARPWVTAVREGSIESRRLVTNQAIIDAILDCAPQTVLDIGCGEGWLVRELAKAGIGSLGIDIIPELINSAEQGGGGRFRQLSYEQLSADILKEKFDVAVCNFSLLGHESVNHLFQQVPALLHKSGAFLVQTIHPVAGCGEANYEDGWREGSWTGFSDEFRDPAPWYFRTLETWKSLFLDKGFRLKQIVEPINPKTNTPASIIFSAVPNN